MLSGGGHELNQAGQDSLLEQMEAPWVNLINDEPTFSFSNHLTQNSVLWY